MYGILTIGLIVIIYAHKSGSQLSCKDENNLKVDWFIAMKFPNSYDFVYLTPEITKWKASSFDLESDQNMVAVTLSQSYVKDYFYAYYNDEPANSGFGYSERGHLKGVVNFDKTGGYWLIHSVPKFPFAGSYQYKEGQRVFGQSFICVNLGTEHLSSIVIQLLMMQSTVYSFNLPEDFSEDVALMQDLGRFVRNRKFRNQTNNVLSLKTPNDATVIHLGKSKDFNEDLYSGLIAPSLKASLYVESWIRGHRVDSDCQCKYHVFNVKYVNLTSDIYKETKDHSKWATSTTASQPYVCIGDVNRMTSQFIRGGGSMCISNLAVWTTFKALVYDYERCDGW